MGRKKTKKPKRERTGPQRQPDDGALAATAYDLEEAWVAICAAGASPGARHRWPSVAVTSAAILRAMAVDSMSSSPNAEHVQVDLQALIDRCAEVANVGVMQEDYVGTDPSALVTVRIGDELLRLFPGTVERPVADVTRAIRLAAMIDPILMKRHQFGLQNILRVALRYADRCVEEFQKAWTPLPDLQVGDPILVTAPEIVVARSLQTLGAEELFLGRADQRALNWMTTSAATAEYTMDGMSGFGRFLRFRTGGQNPRDRWIPVAFVPEILSHAVAELIETVQHQPQVKGLVRQFIVTEARRALMRFSDTVVGPPDLDDVPFPTHNEDIQWLVPFGDRRILAVQIVNVLDLSKSEFQNFPVIDIARRARDSDEPLRISFGGKGVITLPPGTEVVPLVVLGGPSHLVVSQRPGCAFMALEDLTWIAETAAGDDDLYTFARELSAPDFPKSMGWEAINYWEPWRTNGKSFFSGGIRPSAMYFEAHAGEAEWERAVQLSPLESALFAVGLPALRDSQLAELNDGPAHVSFTAGPPHYDAERARHVAPRVEAWTIALTSPPVAFPLGNLDEAGENTHRLFLGLSGGLGFAMQQIAPVWKRAHAEVAITGYRVQLIEAPYNSMNKPIVARVESLPSGGQPAIAEWTISVESFVEEVNGNPHAANKLTSEAIEQLARSGGVTANDASTIREGWLTAPPFFTLDVGSSRTHRVHLPPPTTIDESDESAVARVLAQRLSTAGVQPGIYRGAEANELIRVHLADHALTELLARIAQHDKWRIIHAGGHVPLSGGVSQHRAGQLF